MGRGAPPAKRIPVSGPWITQLEIDYVTDAVRTAWYENAGSYVRRFEEAFARYAGKHAVSAPSCTSAIHLALAGCGIGPGDEVIVPEITWIASSAPIGYLGARPVFADVDPATWCLTAASFEANLTPRTKAVIPVDVYGSMPDMAAIRAVADRHGVRVIEDAAEAIGSTFRGGRAGTFGDVGVYSFHGSKTLSTGEGGMLVTGDDAVYERILELRDHGRRKGDKAFYNREVAFKYKMSDLQAALGLAQLERLDELVQRKREIFGWYREHLADVTGLQLNAEPEGVQNSYWLVTAIYGEVSRIDKDVLLERLLARGIDARPFFRPLSSLPAYEALPGVAEARDRNRVSYSLSPFAINLPTALNLTAEQVAYVCDELKAILRGDPA